MSQTEIGNRQIQSVIAGLVAGAAWGQNFIAEECLPPANTYGENFVYETWGNEGLEDVGSAKRGLNAATKELDPPNNSSVSAVLEEYALTTKLDYRIMKAAQIQDQLRTMESADGMSAVDRLRLGRALRLQYAIQIQKEKAVASLVFGTGNYVNALGWGGGLGNAAVDFTATGIISKIWLAKQSVAEIYGFEPDTMILGKQKFRDLLVNSDVLARITGGANNAQPATVDFDLLAKVFGVKRFLVGSVVSQTLQPAGDPSSTTVTNLWTTTSAALIYTGLPPAGEVVRTGESGNSPSADLTSLAFGKVFYMDVPQTGVRYDVQTWMEPNNKIEHLEATEFFKVAQVMKAGAIFTT